MPPYNQPSQYTYTLEIPDHEWEPSGNVDMGDDARSLLIGPTVIINNCQMHMLALEVVDVDGTQQAVAASAAAEFSALQALYSDAYRTVTIADRQYVVYCHPFSN